MNYWALPPYKINFTGASPTSSMLQDGVAEFYGLTGLVFDNAGNLIVAGYQDHSIRKVSPDGIVSTIAGNGTAGYVNGTGSGATFNLPASVVLDAAQNIYVADLGNNSIRKITPAGVVTTLAGNGTIGSADGTGSAARFHNPYSITIDASGNLYVADSENNAIRKVTQSGVVTTVAGVCGAAAGFADGTGSAAKFSSPKNLAIDASGTIYLTDCNNNRVRKMTSAGVVTTIAGSGVQGFVNGTGTAAQFSKPYGIAVDNSSNVYVTELITGTIRKITSAGVVTTYAGTGTPGFADGPAATAQFQWPTGLTLDASGNLYEADNETHRVRKITPGGIVSTVAGNGTPGFVDTPAPTQYSVSNGAFDENGNTLFIIKDRNIMNATGVSVGTLASYTDPVTGYVHNSIGKEISIVPVPSSCRDFYVIYTIACVNQWYEEVALLYTKVSLSSTGVVSIISNGTFIDKDGGDFSCIATSKLITASNTRHLYFLYPGGINRYTISSSGIGSSLALGMPAVSLYASELEVSSDDNILAWGSNNGSKVYLYDLSNFSTGFKTLTLTLSNANIFGCEFSPDNLQLYISLTSTAGSGIYKMPVTLASGTATLTQITSGHYTNTQLELARDGYIYAVDGNSSPAGLLGKLNPSTDIMSASGLSNIIYSNATSWANFYRLPDQVDGENYDYFFGTPKLSNSFTINSTAVSPTTALNTFTCSTITLANTAGVASAYQITINKADANGNVIAGYSYTTGLVGSAPAASIDIKALNSNYLATNSGYYKIQFYAQNACSSGTSSGLIQNSTISPASANFILNDGIGDTTTIYSTLPGGNVSAYGASLTGTNSTGYTATYQVIIDQVDCTTGAVLTANIVNIPTTSVLNGNPANIAAVAFNAKSSPRGYFNSHAGCFKITYTVTNACGSSVKTGYFNSDPAVFRLAGITTSASNNTASIYPNPTNGITTVSFTVEQDNTVKCLLRNLQGGVSYTAFQNQFVSKGSNEISFDASSLPAGIYLYELNDGSDTFQTGKLVVTK